MQSCFIMMPFIDRFQGYYKHIFSPAVTSLGLLPVKVDEIYTPTQISFDVYEQIRSARIILADVSGKNPNVNYELGIAHALGKKTVIITQNADDVPFDYRHLRYIVYDTQNARWEEKLEQSIKTSIFHALNMNEATTHLTGSDLKEVLDFLENTALDASYEISKRSVITSDLDGNSHVEQSWTIKAISDVTHILFGVVGYMPGTINLTKAYDRTNGDKLRTLISLAEEKHVRFIILLNKMLKSGETLEFDLTYTAEKYFTELFDKNRFTMFQRANSRRGVLYRSRTDVYNFPANDFTRGLVVKFNNSAPLEGGQLKEGNGIVTLTVQLEWTSPYAGPYSYDLASNWFVLS